MSETAMSNNTSAACPACGSPLVAITIHVGAGERTMCSCGRCDQRFWQRDGRLTTLDGVISELGQPEAPRLRYRP